jgi:electron transfer flavoprotein-quinone oxidoreductase
MSELAQQKLPALACGVVERMFRVDNPSPKPGLRRIVREEMRRNGVRLRDAVGQGLRALRTFG